MLFVHIFAIKPLDFPLTILKLEAQVRIALIVKYNVNLSSGTLFETAYKNLTILSPKML